MSAALLSYDKLARTFKGWSTKMRLCGPYIQINDTNQHQTTTMFHVETFLIARGHVILLDGHYGAKYPLVVTRGKLCEFLGMIIDFAMMKKSCATEQHIFIKTLCAELPDELKRHCKSALAPSFFNVDRNAEPIFNQCQEERRKKTEKILCLGQRSRTCAQLATRFH